MQITGEGNCCRNTLNSIFIRAWGFMLRHLD